MLTALNGIDLPIQIFARGVDPRHLASQVAPQVAVHQGPADLAAVLPQARLTVESSLAAYRVNRVDFFTLLDNQMTVLNYEIAYATSVVSQNKALAEIEFIAGTAVF